MPRERQISFFVLLADVVALGHLIVGTLIVILGETTEVFKALGNKHTGVKFIFEYLDRPVYHFVKPLLPQTESDSLFVIASCLLVLTLGSALYGLASYVVLKVLGGIFGIKD